MASHDNPMTSNLRIPSFIVAFLRVLRWVVHYAKGRRQLREIGETKLKSGGQSWKPALNLTQTFIIPELDWGEISVKIRWSQEKEKKGLRQNPKTFSGRNHKFKRFFRPKTGDLQKKGLRRNPKAFSGRNHKFKRFFRPKTGHLQKKGLRRNSKAFSGRNHKFKRFLRPKTATFSA